MDISQENKLSELIMRHLQGDNSPQDLQQLKQLLNDDAEAVELYVEYMMQFSALSQPGKIILEDFSEESSPSMLDTSLWIALSKYEMEAPEINLPKEQTRQELIQKVVYPPKEKRALSKGGIGTLIFSAAAVITLILFVRFAPPKGGIEVAMLTDSIDAKWADIDPSMQTGTRLVTSSEKLLLREGFAELTFNNQAKAVFEAPCEFQILTDDRIALIYGKLYAVVPPSAIGFSVYTSNAKIVDLGTEFGVQAEAGGDTQLYVLKGKTSLIAGEEAYRASIEVTENKAKGVSGMTGTVSDITFDQKLFVRGIDSETNIVWRGENVELASILAGGNGLSPVFNGPTLNPNTGEYEIKPLVSQPYITDYSYNPVPDNVFVDGVFVPDGSRGPVTITSQGHQFECPATSGKINRDIVVLYKPHDRSLSDMQPALFDGIIYGSQEHPCVLLHSNIGITIDLDRIRQTYPGQEIAQLRTGYGLTWAEKSGKADFFILVDGVLKHEDRDLPSRENSQSATIKLEPNARFLTFVVTDSLTSASSPDDAYSFDFFYLLEPELVLQ